MNWELIQQLLDEPGGAVIYHATSNTNNYYPLKGKLEGNYSLLAPMSEEEFVTSTKLQDNKYIGIENYTGDMKIYSSYHAISWFRL